MGYCKNVTIRNLHTESTIPLSLTSKFVPFDTSVPNTLSHVFTSSSLSYSQLNQSYANTSTFLWDDIHFINISGFSTTDRVVDFACSSKAPCTGWSFKDINLTSTNISANDDYICQNMNATGLDQCHG